MPLLAFSGTQDEIVDYPTQTAQVLKFAEDHLELPIKVVSYQGRHDLTLEELRLFMAEVTVFLSKVFKAPTLNNYLQDIKEYEVYDKFEENKYVKED